MRVRPYPYSYGLYFRPSNKNFNTKITKFIYLLYTYSIAIEHLYEIVIEFFFSRMYFIILRGCVSPISSNIWYIEYQKSINYIYINFFCCCWDFWIYFLVFHESVWNQWIEYRRYRIIVRIYMVLIRTFRRENITIVINTDSSAVIF